MMTSLIHAVASLCIHKISPNLKKDETSPSNYSKAISFNQQKILGKKSLLRRLVKCFSENQYFTQSYHVSQKAEF